jgi:hypothetical protein
MKKHIAVHSKYFYVNLLVLAALRTLALRASVFFRPFNTQNRALKAASPVILMVYRKAPRKIPVEKKSVKVVHIHIVQ